MTKQGSKQCVKFTPVCCGGMSLRRGVKEKVNAMKMDEDCREGGGAGEEKSVAEVIGGGGQGECCSGEGGYSTGDVE